MEIISYVQDKPRKSFSFPVFEHKERKSYASSITYSSFSTEIKSFNAQRVKSGFSVKNALKITGSTVAEVQKILLANVKLIISTILIAALIIAGVYFGVSINSKIKNYTGPLTLNNEDSLDIENLNKLMETFALEGRVDYDEEGKLLDSNTLPVQVFTQPVTYQNYKVRAGDTISGIAKKFGLRNISTLISVNDIGNVRQLGAGQKLKIPSIDGVIYTVKKGDSLDSIITKNKIKLEQLLDVNELTSETLSVGQQLFLPGVGLDANTLKNAMGDLFKLPIAAKFRWSSPYGYRIDPIAGVKSFHTGIDMACPTGTPILASMSGKVTTTGINRVYGNYVIIDHGNGYQTLYAHMSKIIATKGQWVSQGTRIGLVGSTGYSTGPHLHFTVYKNGKLVDPKTVIK